MLTLNYSPEPEDVAAIRAAFHGPVVVNRKVAERLMDAGCLEMYGTPSDPVDRLYMDRVEIRLSEFGYRLACQMLS